MSSKSKLYFSNDNISSIFMTTALAMISNGVTGVIAVLIDGIIASQLLGEEEMAGNVVEHAIRKGNDSVCVNYRLFADRDSICFSIMDLGDRFDPAAFYELYHDSDPERLFGIRMVMNMAKEVLYYNTYRSNNLTIYLETDSDISISS